MGACGGDPGKFGGCALSNSGMKSNSVIKTISAIVVFIGLIWLSILIYRTLMLPIVLVFAGFNSKFKIIQGCAVFYNQHKPRC
jgi:hypothetical protein